jgi:hypothetical protein
VSYVRKHYLALGGKFGEGGGRGTTDEELKLLEDVITSLERELE